VGLTTLPSSVSRLSRQCRILNISQPYRPPRPVTGIASLQRNVKSPLKLIFTERFDLVVRTAVSLSDEQGSYIYEETRFPD
jgi:hypothetical protein